jgi:hypothetical protein
MRTINSFFILFFFTLSLGTLVFAQELPEDMAVPEEKLETTEMLEEGVVTGPVVSLDADSGVITVNVDEGVENTFFVVSGETILWKGIDDVELSDIKEGDKAEVGYYTDGEGKLIASWVDILIEEEIFPFEAAEGVKEEDGR